MVQQHHHQLLIAVNIALSLFVLYCRHTAVMKFLSTLSLLSISYYKHCLAELALCLCVGGWLQSGKMYYKTKHIAQTYSKYICILSSVIILIGIFKFFYVLLFRRLLFQTVGANWPGLGELEFI